MTDRDALLAAILSDPTDDLPRLCFADWLDENGESERAEFIRVQVELARKPPQNIICHGCGKGIIVDERVCDGCTCNSPRGCNHGIVPDYVCTCDVCDPEQTGSVRWSPLRRRERQLWDSHGSYRWFDDEWRGWVLGPSVNHRSRQSGNLARGFISSICLSWQDWLHHHEALYWHPKQTVECLNRCRYDATSRKRIWRSDLLGGWLECDQCPSSPFVPRPFVATAQPITEVELTTAHQITEAELTTWPVWDSSTHHSVGYLDENGRGVDFTRVKCPACGDLGLVNAVNGPIVAGDPVYQCPACRGEPLNKWTCPKWPTITFKMP